MENNLLSQFLTSFRTSRTCRLVLMFTMLIFLFFAFSPAGVGATANATNKIVEPEVGKSILALELNNNLIDLHAENARF